PLDLFYNIDKKGRGTSEPPLKTTPPRGRRNQRWLRRKRKPRLRRPRLRRRRSSPLRTWPRSFRKPGRRRAPPTRFGYIYGAWSDSRTGSIPGINSKKGRNFSTRSGKDFGRSTSPSRRRKPPRRRPANRGEGLRPLPSPPGFGNGARRRGPIPFFPFGSGRNG